jgi:hypothetical protein
LRAVAAGRTVLAFLLTAAAFAQESPPPKAGAEPAPSLKVGGVSYHEVNFYQLSAFKYRIVDASTGASEAEIAEARRQDRIPAWVRFYDGKPVALTGFMLTITFEQGLATKFILMRDTNTCCYGNVPNINEFVIVTMKDKGAKAVQDVPVTILGTFRIIERYEEGYLLPIFEMTGDRLLDR